MEKRDVAKWVRSGKLTVTDPAHYQADNMIVLFSDFGLQGPIRVR